MIFPDIKKHYNFILKHEALRLPKIRITNNTNFSKKKLIKLCILFRL